MAEASDSAPMSRQDIQAKIVALAWQDETFRKRLVSDPKGLFEERLKVKFPTSLKITVHEEGENDLHFVIPAKPRGTGSELSDTDLEKVAGGVVNDRSSIGGGTVIGSPMVPDLPKVW